MINAPDDVRRAVGAAVAARAAPERSACSRRARRCASTICTRGSTPAAARAHAGAVGAERADVRRRGSDRRAERRQSGAARASRAEDERLLGDHREPGRPSACRTRGCTPSSAPASRSGRRPSTRWATRSRCSIATAGSCAATRRSPRTCGRPVTALRGLTCDEVGLCGGAVSRSARSAAPPAAPASTRKSRVPATGSSASRPARCVDATDGAAIVQIAKNVTLEIQNARRMRQMSDELAADQQPAGRDRRAAEGDPGAAAAGREALGDRPARRRRRARAEQPADQRDRLRAAAAGGTAGRREGEHAAAAGGARRTTCAASPRNRSAPRRSSATCSRSRAGSPPRAPSRTSPT